MHAESVHQKASALRKRGFTHREISKKLGISLGSAFLWTKGIVVTREQKREILERARISAFTPERREKLRKWAQIELPKYRRKYNQEDLLRKIIVFHQKHGRIPLKRELNQYREYQKHFGSWNHAIRLAGFHPNPQLFAFKFHAKDGHKCDSFTEKIVDDWLFEKGILHKRNVPYEGTRMTADFMLNDGTLVEFFGLAGVQDKYDELISKKRAWCAKKGTSLIEIYPRNLFPKNQLSRLIKTQ